MKSKFKWLVPFDGRLSMPPRKARFWFYIIFGLFAGFFMISAGFSCYTKDVATGLSQGEALLDALKIGAVLSLPLAMMGALYFFLLALFTSVIIPDAIKVGKAIWKGIRGIPAACRAVVGACKSGASAVRNMNAVDGLALMAVCGVFGIFAGSLYLAWPWAVGLHNLLPNWLHTDGDWMGIFLIDWIICIIPNALLAGVWMTCMKACVSAFRDKNS